MLKHKNKKDSWSFWFTVGLISYLLIAPNTTIIRVLVTTIPPLEFTFLRSAVIVLVSFPLILRAIRKFNRQTLTYTVAAGLCLAIATITLTYGVKYSDASYSVIMGLVSPILLVIFSSRFLGDKINLRAAAGVTVAAIGALVVVAAPLIVSGNSSTHFYPLATVLLLINSFFFTISIMLSRKSNEAGMPLSANAGVMALIVMIISFFGMYAVEGPPTHLLNNSFNMWIGIIYSGVVVVFIARILNIASYERIGAPATSGLNYLSVIVGAIIPVVILGEKLPSTIVLGGVLILIGVYLTEKHRARHHRYGHIHSQ